MDQVVEDLLSCLDDPALALLQWNEAFGVVQVGCTSLSAILHSCSICMSTEGIQGLHCSLAGGQKLRQEESRSDTVP